jgi:hypothetical protein
LNGRRLRNQNPYYKTVADSGGRAAGRWSHLNSASVAQNAFYPFSRIPRQPVAREQAFRIAERDERVVSDERHVMASVAG